MSNTVINMAHYIDMEDIYKIKYPTFSVASETAVHMLLGCILKKRSVFCEEKTSEEIKPQYKNKFGEEKVLDEE
jgi:hypothetical protein